MRITDRSHINNLPEKVIQWLSGQIAPLEGDVIIKTFVLPQEFGYVKSSCIYTPATDPDKHEVFYAKRKGRPNLSRMIRHPPVDVMRVTVIGGGGKVWTMYGGEAACKEPTDPFLKASEAEGSFRFWSEHALSAEMFEYEI